jgi:hypothetical protein
VLIREGQPAGALYLVLGGTLEVSYAGGQQHIPLGCGEVIGEMEQIHQAGARFERVLHRLPASDS